MIEASLPALKDIFAADVTRDIAPVVYFHEQDPARVAHEVAEYIVTGGYPADHPRHRQVPSGIHEQFVKLLDGISHELKGQASLPASWISGFYGSGKSSFAKLLGLALDSMVLPSGETLAEALLTRDDSPLRDNFRRAWREVRALVDPIAVVFDIGAVSRDDEHVHVAVRRMVARRLGYCDQSHYVADHELRLELDGKYAAFEDAAQRTLGRPWNEARRGALAEEDFSHVMHVMHAERYVDPLSWYDSRTGTATQTGIGSAVDETVRAIAHMLDFRAKGSTLFIVVDEVSQYIHDSESRMLKLQSFVSDLGQRLKGRVWLLATGQQKLEEQANATLAKLKDRFPERLRVHLEPNNIRDVVHKRLLRKAPRAEPEIRALFVKHKADLRLYGYQCAEVTEEDFVEVYPMLPGHVDLLMQITTSLRSSSRSRGDDYAIRGLLQLLGELFRTQKLGERELGTLVTLDQIYEVQHTALGGDVQNSLTHLFNTPEVQADPVAARVAKVVSLLQLIQDKTPTTPALISQCLYGRLGEGTCEPAVSRALEMMRGLGLVTWSDKQGWKLQSSAGQEWLRERDDRGIPRHEVSEVVLGKLATLMGTAAKPQLRTRPFPFATLMSDAKRYDDERVNRVSDAAVVTVDVRLLDAEDDRKAARWVQDSDSAALRDRVVWVSGPTTALLAQARDLARSRKQVAKYADRVTSIGPDRQRLFYDEQSRCEALETAVQDALADCLLAGEIYFRARVLDKSRHGVTFAAVVTGAANEILPALYPSFVDMSVTPAELNQLLAPALAGLSPKFMADQLGIFELDQGKYVPSCKGELPARILDLVVRDGGVGGERLLGHFAGPPFGCAADVVKACVVGLLRGEKIAIRTETSTVIGSVRDPGAQEMFTRDRDLRRADVMPRVENDVTIRDITAICRLFEEALNVPLDREKDAIVDATFRTFGQQAERLRSVEARLARLPGHQEAPKALVDLRKAFEDCKRSRFVEDCVRALKRSLEALRDGMQVLRTLDAELTDERVAAVQRAARVRDTELAQLAEAGLVGEVAGAAAALDEHFAAGRPWRDIAQLDRHLEAVVDVYRSHRRDQIARQDGLADEARQRVRHRHGWESLTNEQGQGVLRLIGEAVVDTTAEAVQPALAVLRDTIETRIARGEEAANRRLDALISARSGGNGGGVHVVAVEVRGLLSGREIETPEQLDRVLADLRAQLVAKLGSSSSGAKTRLRLE